VIHQETDPGIDKIRRLSNGPIESFNRKPKDYKRNSRGVDDFNFTRLRLLLATRSNIHILGTPKRLKDVLNKTGKTRGSYKK
ncbi:MAG: transposase, partial [Anaerorhabdus sp.]